MGADLQAPRGRRTLLLHDERQTGRICGKLPINKGKLYAVGALIGGIVFGLLCLGGAILW